LNNRKGSTTPREYVIYRANQSLAEIGDQKNREKPAIGLTKSPPSPRRGQGTHKFQIKVRAICPNLGLQKIVHLNSSFAENGAERSLRHVGRVMRDRNFPSGLRMAPNLVTACARAVEAKSKCA
jgi:hypothetical protein